MEADYIGNHAVWIPGGYGRLSQLSPQLLASYGLYPIPGTGPAGYNNENARALLSDPISSTAVQQFLASSKLSYPILLTPDSGMIQSYNVTALPTVVLIDADGKIVYHHVGAGGDKALREALAQLGLESEPVR